MVADINENGGRRVANEVPDSMSFLKTNVASEEDWHNLMEITESRYGRIDCLVNNAGTSYRNKVCPFSIDVISLVHK